MNAIVTPRQSTLPANLVSILRFIRSKRLNLASMKDDVVTETNLHRLYPPFPVVIRINEAGAPFTGDCFPVECFTQSSDTVTYVAHILDYRVLDKGHPMRRSIAERLYEVVSTVPARYTGAAFDLTYDEVKESVTSVPVWGWREKV